ncbi:MAG: Uma2 family endonuclease [Planctomycetaceae bacterium]|nr:Uma2 family endonuclease [Planctomycetaceae bacterium]
MTLEVVSDTSVVKDTQELRSLYWLAGIQEYWLVDARAALSFDTLKTQFHGLHADAAASRWLAEVERLRAIVSVAREQGPHRQPTVYARNAIAIAAPLRRIFPPPPLSGH